MRSPLVLALAVVSVALAAAPAATAAPVAARTAACAHQRVTSSYAGSVLRALRARRDVWGNALIARPNGPTYGAVQRLLKPLLFARSKRGSLTTSGVYYLPFAQPLGVKGASTVALHVADGSEILAQTADGPGLSVFVGPAGRERFGSCRARLAPAALADGYLPILETKYVDAGGNRYSQESFAVRGLGTGALVSFVRLSADARSGGGALLRLVPRASRKARTTQGAVGYRVLPGESRTIYAAWIVSPFGTPAAEPVDARTYDGARQRLVEFWQARLAASTPFDVPEPVVENRWSGEQGPSMCGAPSRSRYICSCRVRGRPER